MVLTPCHCSNPSVCVNSSASHSRLRWVLLLSPFDRSRNSGAARLRSLSQGHRAGDSAEI